VLAAAEGRSDSAIACQLQVNRHTVILWRQRFLQEGKESLWRWRRAGAASRPMGREDSSHREGDLTDQAQRDDPMELSIDGGKPRVE